MDFYQTIPQRNVKNMVKRNMKDRINQVIAEQNECCFSKTDPDYIHPISEIEDYRNLEIEREKPQPDYFVIDYFKNTIRLLYAYETWNYISEDFILDTINDIFVDLSYFRRNPCNPYFEFLGERYGLTLQDFDGFHEADYLEYFLENEMDNESIFKLWMTYLDHTGRKNPTGVVDAKSLKSMKNLNPFDEMGTYIRDSLDDLESPQIKKAIRFLKEPKIEDEIRCIEIHPGQLSLF